MQPSLDPAEYAQLGIDILTAAIAAVIIAFLTSKPSLFSIVPGVRVESGLVRQSVRPHLVFFFGFSVDSNLISSTPVHSMYRRGSCGRSQLCSTPRSSKYVSRPHAGYPGRPALLYTGTRPQLFLSTLPPNSKLVADVSSPPPKFDPCSFERAWAIPIAAIAD
ncbi:hypothetical protein EW146_g2100 [Bondarzewia mesenterica]|uniref:Uncharacterized protein n=1 Tax=Bondarzewia mesenterica TaxID=1095465 RepID=A0A4S4M1U0_9AGAM|nr:hypothetical protein EW146_g2100 [Bondarzewia mesenterica]